MVLGSLGPDSITIGLAPGDHSRVALDLDGDRDADRTVRLSGIERIRTLLGAAGDQIAIDDPHGVVARHVPEACASVAGSSGCACRTLLAPWEP